MALNGARITIRPGEPPALVGRNGAGKSPGAVLRRPVRMGDAPARGALGRSVGSGDAFAAGPIHGLLAGTGMERALAYGTAHGALVMTTPGDVSMAALTAVEALIAGCPAHVRR